MWRSLALETARRLEAAGGHQAATLADEYWDAPERFIQECVSWPPETEPAPYQLQAARDLWQYKRVAERAPRGTGKTTTAALIALWFAITRDGRGEDWKVVTTASAWRQLTHYLWPEIRLWARRLNWAKLGREPFNRFELQQMRLRLEHGEVFAVASDDPAKIEGAHAQHLLWVFDESKSIPDAMFDAAEGSLVSEQDAGSEALVFAISTPGRKQGRFYDIFRRLPGLTDWHPTKITVEDAVEAGRISRSWIERVKALWGEDSALYRMHVLAEFAEESLYGIIPLEWVEAAVARWHQHQPSFEGNGASLPRATSIGVDVGEGGSGGDPTVIATVRGGWYVEELHKYDQLSPGTELMEVVGRVGQMMDVQGCPAYIDSIGIGAGVVARLREERHRGTVAFHAGYSTNLLDASGEFGFFNWRSAMWWLMREMLDPASGMNVALPPDDELIEELVTPQATITSRGQHQVESKDEIRRRLKRGRSTNCADAVLQALVGPILQRELEQSQQTELMYRPRAVGERW